MATPLLDLVNNICSSLLLPPVDTVEGRISKNVSLIMHCFNSVAIELTNVFDWIEQREKCVFFADKGAAYDTTVGGYDLDKLTANTFERMSTRYLYDTINRKRVAEILPDNEIERELTPSGTTKFIRQQKCIIFVPEPAVNNVFAFYYQTKNVAYTVDTAGKKTMKLKFNNDMDYSVLNDNLLLKAAISKYKNFVGLDNTQDYDEYQTYLKQIKESKAPAATILPQGSDAGLFTRDEIIHPIDIF